MAKKPHRASRLFVGGRSSERATQPTKADLSAETKRYLIKTLHNASHAEVANVLRAIGFRQGWLAPKPSPEQMNAAISAEARKYLTTPDGKIVLERRRVELVEREAEHYISSSVGRKRVEDAIARLGAAEVVENDDLMNRVCREAAKREVETWLRSQRGKQAVEAILASAVDEKVSDLTKLERADWIRKKLRELNDGQVTA